MLYPTDVDAIRRELELDPAEIATRKAYLEITAADIALLRDIHVRLQEQSSQHIHAFYEHIRGVDSLRRLIPDEATLEQLKQRQADYFTALTAGNYDDSYVEQRLRVGLVHQHIGLEPKWYIGAYRKYLAELTTAVWKLCAPDQQRALDTWNAVFKVVMFDMGLGLDTYHAAATARIRELKTYAEQIIGGMPNALLVLDAQLRVQFANPAFCASFGIDATETLNGRPLQTWLQQPLLLERARQVLDDGQAQQFIPIDVTIDAHTQHFDVDISLAHLNGEQQLLLTLQDVTERVVAARALQDSEQRLAATFNQAAVGIAHLTPDGRWQRVNQRLCDILGYSEAELLQQTSRDITHPDDILAEDLHVRELMSGKLQEYQLDKRFLHKDGHSVWVNISVAAVHDEHGEPGYFIAVIEDISSRVQAETAFRAIVEATATVTGKDFFHTLARKLAEALDVKFAFVGKLTAPHSDTVNMTALWAGGDFAEPFDYKLTGTPCENVVGNTICTFPSNVARQFPEDTLLVQMGIESYMGIPVFDRDQRALGIIAVMDDRPMHEIRLTHSVLNILAARASAEIERNATLTTLLLHERAIKASSNGIVIVDARQEDMPISYVNPALERITGYSAAEMLGRNCRFLQGDDRQQAGIATLAQALRDGIGTQVVLRNYRKDGRMFWNEINVSPVRDAQGTLTHYVGIQTDVTERIQHETQIAHLATHNGLTGLPNRNLLKDRFEQASAHAERDGQSVALLLIDLDRFKNINESLSHAHGDRLLIEIADRLSNSLREGDTVAHLGADDFVVMLAGDEDPHQLTETLDRLLRTISAPIDLDGHELVMSAGVGISVYPQDGKDFGTLLKNADTARYRAKDLGHNRFQFYAEQMNARALSRLTLESALHHAIERNELLLHYQPQLDLTTGAIVGVEALIRWQRPEHGMVSPADFIPLAEESGLIVPIGAWVLRTACAQMRAWHAAGHTQLRIAINLSPRQFREPDLEGMVHKALLDSGLDPTALELEITESSLMENADHAIATLNALNALGVHLAIDDFGTGYSSLSYLKRFPIDVVKIDRSFVNEVTSDPDDAAIARSIIALAHSMRLKVVAEGIETGAQLAFLRRNRCDMMQGYYFSRPLPVADVDALLRSGRQLELPAVQMANARTVVILDESPRLRAQLGSCLEQQNCQVLTAETFAHAMDLIATHSPGVFLYGCSQHVDVRQKLAAVREIHPGTLPLLIVSNCEKTTIDAILDSGLAQNALFQPIDNEALQDAVRAAFTVFDQHNAYLSKIEQLKTDSAILLHGRSPSKHGSCLN